MLLRCWSLRSLAVAFGFRAQGLLFAKSGMFSYAVRYQALTLRPCSSIFCGFSAFWQCGFLPVQIQSRCSPGSGLGSTCTWLSGVFSLLESGTFSQLFCQFSDIGIVKNMAIYIADIFFHLFVVNIFSWQFCRAKYFYFL